MCSPHGDSTCYEIDLRYSFCCCVRWCLVLLNFFRYLNASDKICLVKKRNKFVSKRISWITINTSSCSKARKWSDYYTARCRERTIFRTLILSRRQWYDCRHLASNLWHTYTYMYTEVTLSNYCKLLYDTSASQITYACSYVRRFTKPVFHIRKKIVFTLKTR